MVATILAALDLIGVLPQRRLPLQVRWGATDQTNVALSCSAQIGKQMRDCGWYYGDALPPPVDRRIFGDAAVVVDALADELAVIRLQLGDLDAFADEVCELNDISRINIRLLPVSNRAIFRRPVAAGFSCLAMARRDLSLRAFS